jgi:hypothetical protein
MNAKAKFGLGNRTGQFEALLLLLLAASGAARADYNSTKLSAIFEPYLDSALFMNLKRTANYRCLYFFDLCREFCESEANSCASLPAQC